MVRSLDSFDEADRTIVEALRSDSEEILAEVARDLSALLDDPLSLEVVRIIHAPGRPEYRTRLALALGPVLELAAEATASAGSEGAGDPGGLAEESAQSLFHQESLLSSSGLEAVSGGLEAIFRDAAVPVSVRRSVLEAAVRAPQSWHEGAVRAAWASGDEAWRGTALFCMGCLLTIDFSPEIEEATRSNSGRLRREGLIAARERRMVGLLPEARRVALNDRANPELRTEALSLLGLLGSEEDLEPLGSLREEANGDVAAAVELAIVQIDSRRTEDDETSSQPTA